MSKAKVASIDFIEFVFTGPPTADIAAMVKVLDSDGDPIEAGTWYHDGQYWRYQVGVELVPRMIVASVAKSVDGTAGDVMVDMKSVAGLVHQGSTDDPAAQRRALKEKLMGKKVDASAAPKPEKSIDKSHWQKCPSCQQLFNPAEGEVLDCPSCGEGKCTVICLPDISGPCLDCQALSADPEEGGYDARLAANAVSAQLFNGKPPVPKGMSAADAEDEGEDE